MAIVDNVHGMDCTRDMIRRDRVDKWIGNGSWNALKSSDN